MAGARHAAGQDLAERLDARRDEIEQTLLTRVHAVSDPAEVGDPEYMRGLKAAISVALDSGLAVLEGERDPVPIPSELVDQARNAARNGVSLVTVLRRYFAGYTLLCDYLLQEANTHSALQEALRSESLIFDQVVLAITTAYTQEIERRRQTSEHRRTECVKNLLTGSFVDMQELEYELGDWHLGLVAAGPEAPRMMRCLAASLDRRILLVRPGGELVWAWLGGRSKMVARRASEEAASLTSGEVLVAIGEPGRGIHGWRLTHQQALAALPVAVDGKARIVSYSDVAILASALGDDVLVGSLSELYLAPLKEERDGGVVLRETLQAYFEARRSIASAAAALGVSRQTVGSRLQVAEERIGQSLDACGTELETALRLWDLGHPSRDQPVGRLAHRA